MPWLKGVLDEYDRRGPTGVVCGRRRNNPMVSRQKGSGMYDYTYTFTESQRNALQVYMPTVETSHLPWTLT
jgi:hypothetical protein